MQIKKTSDVTWWRGTRTNRGSRGVIRRISFQERGVFQPW